METDLAQFKESGLYLLFPDGTRLALTRGLIEERSHALLLDPGRISPQVKDAQAFQLCDVCPKKGSGDSCHAIRPILACWEDIDRFYSYDQVTAVYRGAGSGHVIVAETTLQRALQYLSILSLLYYCETGRKYWPYFYGVHPLMETDDLVARVYLNMFWACDGNAERTRALIGAFHEEISITTRCEMERIRLFCTHDAFVNALILTQLASEFLVDRVEDTIKGRVEAFARGAFD